MADGRIESVDQLIEGILAGTVPRQVRLFAAQGLLPVSRDDLFRLQLLLSADPDDELAELARTSVAEEQTDFVLGWLENDQRTQLELDLLVRMRSDEPIWAVAAQHPATADETLRVLARHGSPLIQDIVMTNQVRLLGCLDLVDDLRENPQVSTVILRRVREFEEEFIAKAAARLEAPPGAQPGPTIEEALTALRSIGSDLPAQDRLPLPSSPDSQLADEAAQRGEPAFARLLRMTTHEKVLTALKGSSEERSILVNSRNHMVVRAVLASPRLSDIEIERFASSRSVSDEVIRLIAQNPRWLRRYPVILALVNNPKTPVQIARRLLPRINVRHLKHLSVNRNINSAVRTQAAKVFAKRR